jgi:predicted 2-oxoglutarate/Fe(II)-dependent dioxygenase YbiX
MVAHTMALFCSTTPPTEEQSSELVAKMPLLAGRPLQVPKFLKTNWRIGQTFSTRDDPDRVQDSWEPPRFVRDAGPIAQARSLRAEELKVPRSKPDQRFAQVIRGVIDEDECVALLQRVNEKGFTPALLNVGMDQQRLMPEVRDGHRIIVDSPELSSWLFEMLRPHLPEQMPGGLQLAGLNERCRFLCYTPGQMFEEHRDGCYRRPLGHAKAGERSMVTVQLYLHDVPRGHGGATTFFPGRSYAVSHQPEAGSVLLFSQDLEHEGSLLQEGLKYTLRTEVMYTKRDNASLPQP